MWLRGQNLAEHLISNTALNHTGNLVRSLHDPLPRLVDVLETFGLLGELMSEKGLCGDEVSDQAAGSAQNHF